MATIVSDQAPGARGDVLSGLLAKQRTVVMGVVNVTPDSFSDGGRFASADAAVEQGLRMAAEGAALIDVGGESTRPGAQPVSLEDELQRVLPVIERLRAATTAVISVDTSKPEVMRAAAAAGAGFINDVRALREPGALAAAAASGCGVCLMHMQGEPRTMQVAPHYTDVVAEVRSFLHARVAACRSAGIAAARLTVDLRDNPTNTGTPSATSSGRCRNTVRLCSRFLPNPNPGSTLSRAASMPAPRQAATRAWRNERTSASTSV